MKFLFYLFMYLSSFFSILFNHASHTQRNDCIYVQTVDLHMGRVNNIDHDNRLNAKH